MRVVVAVVLTPTPEPTVEPTPQVNGAVVYHFFAVSAWAGGEPRIVGDEHSEIRWFSIDAACVLSDLALPEYTTILHKLT